MKALRNQNIVHRDLKPGNILIKKHPHTGKMMVGVRVCACSQFLFPYMEVLLLVLFPYMECEVPALFPYMECEVPALFPYMECEVPALFPYMECEVPALVANCKSAYGVAGGTN